MAADPILLYVLRTQQTERAQETRRGSALFKTPLHFSSSSSPQHQHTHDTHPPIRPVASSSPHCSRPAAPPDQKPPFFMRVVLSRRRVAAGGGGLCIKKKARGFMCGCGGTKAVSISDGSDKSPMATPQTAASATPLITTTTESTRRGAGNRRRLAAVAAAATTSAAAEAPSSFSSSSFYADTTTDDGGPSSMESTPSLSALLRQLGELERSVRFLHTAAGNTNTNNNGSAEADAGGGGGTDANKQQDGGGGRRRHRRTVSEGCGGGSGRVEESVAVVKESADPLGDFRRSMLQMIVEKEIVGGAELRELLHRFLALNSPHHHHIILRAFAEIWEEVFAGYERTPDLLVSHRNRNNNKHHMQAQATR